MGKLASKPTHPSTALMINNLNTVCVSHNNTGSHDDLLFCTQLCVGFFALMWLGELIFSDNIALWDPQKVTKWSLVCLHPTFFQFFLPGHKANRFFEGNTVIICRNPLPWNPMRLFELYISLHDHHFPLSSPLWLTANGTVPTQAFFMWRLCIWFDKDIAGQSMQAVGATSLAENGIIIQGIRRWASAAGKFTSTNTLSSCRLCFTHEHSQVLIDSLLHQARCAVHAWTLHDLCQPPHWALCYLNFYRLLFACFTYSLNEPGHSAMDILPTDNSLYPSLLTSSPHLPQLHIFPQAYRTIGVPWGY